MEFKALVVIPSYNTGGPLLRKTVSGALRATEAPVRVVIDGSDDGSDRSIEPLLEQEERLSIMIKTRNEGKGAAVRSALAKATGEGFTHALIMDADGQHPADRIDDFIELARANPGAMVLGQPVFDDSVPLERLHGRKLSVWLTRFETLSYAVGDPLYGFRVYPIAPLLEVMGPKRRSNRYDFDPEVAVRLHWMGVRSVKIPAKVDYLSKEEGGVSHFNYVRDNLRYIGLHFRLILEAPFQWALRAVGGTSGGKPRTMHTI